MDRIKQYLRQFWGKINGTCSREFGYWHSRSAAKGGPLGVSELSRRDQGYVDGRSSTAGADDGPGAYRSPVVACRPGTSQPSLRTDRKGRRQTGANFVDLALALWNEVRAIEDSEVRPRACCSGSPSGWPTITAIGSPVRQRPSGCGACRELFADRNVPFDVDESGALPVLTAQACPYPELAEQDRGIWRLGTDDVSGNGGRWIAFGRVPAGRGRVLPICRQLTLRDRRRPSVHFRVRCIGHETLRVWRSRSLLRCLERRP